MICTDLLEIICTVLIEVKSLTRSEEDFDAGFHDQFCSTSISETTYQEWRRLRCRLPWPAPSVWATPDSARRPWCRGWAGCSGGSPAATGWWSWWSRPGQRCPGCSCSADWGAPWWGRGTPPAGSSHPPLEQRERERNVLFNTNPKHKTLNSSTLLFQNNFKSSYF